MKTAQLIDFLGANVEPVDRGQLPRILIGSFVVGLMLAAIGTFLVLGVRTDLDQLKPVAFVLLKLAFTLAVVALASICLYRLARPGGEYTTRFAVVALPFVVMCALAVVNLSLVPNSHWQMLLMGQEWRKCVVSIPLLAVVPFAAIVWALHRGAPTDLTRTGAVAGLVAGGLGATAYALHGTGDALPYIALWYGGTLALCSLAGAMLGPRVLRW
jgi:hypothetical protein